ncbi:MAG: hypothetical protein KKH88_02290 [Nanoarchaeota archaeon]|nr:hypothetical protein [Nanoarchaeota archaeon]MBU1445129.1 hypothetical protein [Nanoarchaeota archaeon]MBU2406670.1 hypothetical protein [Nanoarchaeota archaeon]MBU2420085.1 hypothetical protein [Nanoarchaeota archaeon]MBU2475556.1 hypothetical protein [Nanoarchaeota archaeon]
MKKRLVRGVLSLSLIARLLFGGIASADPAEGWAYCHPEHSDVGNYGVLVEGEGFIAKRVHDRDTKEWAWHIETKEGEVIGDDENELRTYATAAMTAQVAYLVDTHGVNELGQGLSDVLREKADTFYTLVELNERLDDLQFLFEWGSRLEGLLVGAKIVEVNPNYSELETQIINRVNSSFFGEFREFCMADSLDQELTAHELSDYFEDKLESFAEKKVEESAVNLRRAASILERDRKLWKSEEAYNFIRDYTGGHVYGLASLNFLKGINEHRSDWRTLLTSFLENFIEGGTGINPRELIRDSSFSELIFSLEPNTFGNLEREVFNQTNIYREITKRYDPKEPEGQATFYLRELNP